MAVSANRLASNDEVTAKLRAGILKDTKAVRLLPGTPVLAAIFFLLSAAVAACGGAEAHLLGFSLMAPLTRGLVFGALLLINAVAAWMAARSMRPGSGALYGGLLALAALAVPELIFIAVFRSYDMHQFVPAGLACLELGLKYAIPTSLLTALVISRGYLVAPVVTGMLTGLVGGMTGLVTLELRCPLQTVPHVGVWHVAVVAVSLALGAGVGWIWTRLRGKLSTSA